MAEAASTIPADIRQLAVRVGGDPTLVQGAGGNLSFKAGDRLWIKASGTWLAQAQEADIFLPVGLAATRHKPAEPVALEAVVGGAGLPLRPSIETALHALMPQRVVLHVHSVNALAWLVQRSGPEALAARLDGLPWAWVPYRKPGLPLSRAVREAHEGAGADTAVLALANHGLVLGARDVAELDDLLETVEARVACPARELAPVDTALLSARCSVSGWRPAGDELLHGVATDDVALAAARQGALYPDHVVFLGAGLPELAPGETLGAALARHEERFGTSPAYVIVPGEGLLVAPDLSAGAEAMLACWSRVTRRLPAEGLAVLGDADVATLLDWDAERYRQALDRAGEGGTP